MHIRGYLKWIGLMGLLAGLGAAPAWGQSLTDTAFRAGVEALEAGTPDEAVRRLEAVIGASPDYYRAGQGSAAYWLGHAHKASSDATQALRVWQDGLDALAASGRFDPRLNDAYTRTVFGLGVEAAYPRATWAYVDLMEQAETVVDDDAQRIVERHVAQVLVLWPEDQHARFVEGGKEKKGRLPLMPDAGPTLAAWWRGEDLELATPRNERLEEHLTRVAQAEQKYAYEEALTGFDDRGALFVRLGEPDQHEVITYQEDARLGEILGQSARVGLSDLPKNEVWYYPSLARTGLYVFIRRSRRYQLATPTDLIPRKLLSSGPTRARLQLVAMMQFLNKVLGEIDPHYAARYAGGVNDILIYPRQNRFYMDLSVLPPGTRLDSYLFSAIHDIERDDADEVRDREALVPQQDTQLFDDLDVLPVVFRYARFLDANGTTRTELFWSHPPDTVLRADRLVQLTTVQKQVDYRTRTWETSRYAPTGDELEGRAYVHTRTLLGDTTQYHLHLQWDLYDVASVPHGLGTRRRTNVFKADSLTALNPDPTRLEMSDLLPSLDLDPDRLETPDSVGLAIKPYPLPKVTSSTPLALYFEVYHLTYGLDDLTQYTVAYEMERREKGGVWRLFRDRAERTVAATTYTGDSRTAREYVIVDLSEMGAIDGLKVTVRITDDITGQTVERSVTFDVEAR